jgi:hypothetical protein
MEIELLPTVSLLPETNSLLIAPVELLAGALNSHLELQRYKILFISGNYSRILNRLNRNFTELEVRRANTLFQLMTIMEENHHSFLIVEHDPLLYEDAEKRVVEYQGPRPSGRPPGRPPSCSTRRLWTLTCKRLPSWLTLVFCIYSEPAPAKARKAEAKMPGEQRTLETYS